MPKKFTIKLTEVVQVKEWLALKRLELVELERKIKLGEQWLLVEILKQNYREHATLKKKSLK